MKGAHGTPVGLFCSQLYQKFWFAIVSKILVRFVSQHRICDIANRVKHRISNIVNTAKTKVEKLCKNIFKKHYYVYNLILRTFNKLTKLKIFMFRELKQQKTGIAYTKVEIFC